MDITAIFITVIGMSIGIYALWYVAITLEELKGIVHSISKNTKKLQQLVDRNITQS